MSVAQMSITKVWLPTGHYCGFSRNYLVCRKKSVTV